MADETVNFGYKFNDEVAASDAAFEIKAANLNDLFNYAGRALFEIMCGSDDVTSNEKRQIELEADSLEDLLYRYLSELLFLRDTEDIMFSEFETTIRNNFKLKAEVGGDTIGNLKEPPKTDIKAITYYKFKVEKRGYGYFAFVVVDL